MGIWQDILGTTSSFFRIGTTGPRLKDSSGALVVRNPGDTADAAITAAQLNVSGNSLIINSDAANSGADYTITISRPASGMTAAYTLTLPVDDGSPSQVLQTDGSGVLSWVNAGSTAQCLTVDTTSLAFGSSSTVNMFTLPANAVLSRVEAIIDTAFNGTPSMSVGIAGTTSKYMASTQVDLSATAGTVFMSHPGLAANVSTENLIISYTSGSASAGAARVLVYYSVPA